jgi:hypothetical protein
MNAPTAVTIITTAGSNQAFISGFKPWMDGCAIVIDGESIDNQIRRNTSPEIPNFLETNDNSNTNNDLRFEQVDYRNPVYVEFYAASPISGFPPQPTGVPKIVVVGNLVSLIGAANFGANTTSSAEFVTLIQASPAASALITVANKTGNNGTSVLTTAFGPTLLTGGVGAGVDLKFPATVTGTQSATVYATAHTCALDVMDVRKPIRCDGMDLLDMSNEYPSRRPVVFNDYGMTTLRNHAPSYAERVADTANQPRFFRVTTATLSNASSFVQRVEIYPAPAVQSFLEYKCSMTPPVVTSLTSNSTIPIPFQFVESVFLPLAERALMDSSFFRGTAAAGAIAGSEQKARAILASLQPNKTKRPRIIPLG